MLRVDTHADFSEIALAHPYPELATSLDGIVPGTLAAMPYVIVVQTDLRGIVWTSRVSRRVGHLSDTFLEEISNMIDGGYPTSLSDIRVGIPLHGRWDRRWPFKTAEGEALDLLTAGCTHAILEVCS